MGAVRFDFGGTAALVTGVGVVEGRPIEACDKASWDATLAVDLTAAWLLTRGCSTVCGRGAARRGRQRRVQRGPARLPRLRLYYAAKGALVGLARTPDPAAARRQWETPTQLGQVAFPAPSFMTGSVPAVDGSVIAGRRA